MDHPTGEWTSHQLSWDLKPQASRLNPNFNDLTYHSCTCKVLAGHIFDRNICKKNIYKHTYITGKAEL